MSPPAGRNTDHDAISGFPKSRKARFTRDFFNQNGFDFPRHAPVAVWGSPRRTIYQSHHDDVCAARLARRAGLGAASIGRIYAEFTYLKAQERKNQSCPRLPGIDEHALHRSQRFVTTFCNLKKRRVFDVVEGKCQAGDCD